MKRARGKAALRLLIALVIMGGLAFALLRGRRAHADLNVPTAGAKKGDFLVFVRCRGSLQARRRVELTAPLDVPDLQIVWLAPVNKQVNAGEVVIRFDGSKLQQDLREKTQALKQAQASLDQAIAQEKIDADQSRPRKSESGYGKGTAGSIEAGHCQHYTGGREQDRFAGC